MMGVAAAFYTGMDGAAVGVDALVKAVVSACFS